MNKLINFFCNGYNLRQKPLNDLFSIINPKIKRSIAISILSLSNHFNTDIRFENKEINWENSLSEYNRNLTRCKDIYKNLIGYSTTEEKILDFGCGPAYSFSTARLMGWDYYAVDYNPAMIDIARIIHKVCESKFFYYDKLSAPEYKDFFDLIIISEVIQHIRYDGELLSIFKLLNKNLKQNGRIIIIDTFEDKKKKIKTKNTLWRTKSEISSLLNSAGFLNIEFSIFKSEFIKKQKTVCKIRK